MFKLCILTYTISHNKPSIWLHLTVTYTQPFYISAHTITQIQLLEAPEDGPVTSETC
jgi:hypothetical protein